MLGMRCWEDGVPGKGEIYKCFSRESQGINRRLKFCQIVPRLTKWQIRVWGKKRHIQSVWPSRSNKAGSSRFLDKVQDKSFTLKIELLANGPIANMTKRYSNKEATYTEASLASLEDG